MHGTMSLKKKLDATYYFIVLLIISTCFGHYYAHHQETMVLIITLAVSFCKDGGGSVNVKLWFFIFYSSVITKMHGPINIK